MSAYDLRRISRELAALADPAPNSTTQGFKLQNLVEYVLGEVAGVKIERRNAFNLARSEEKDLWFRHNPYSSNLPFIDFLVPVECKNERQRTSAAEVREFESKIRDSGGSDGLLVTASGLSGSAPDRAHHAITMALSHGIRITVITATDLARLTTAATFVELLVERSTELRIVQGYSSI